MKMTITEITEWDGEAPSGVDLHLPYECEADDWDDALTQYAEMMEGHGIEVYPVSCKGKITISAITEWEKDEHEMMGDSGHMSDDDITLGLAEEIRTKKEEGKAEGLPFTCFAEDREEALEKYNAAYCEYDYLKAADCE